MRKSAMAAFAILLLLLTSLAANSLQVKAQSAGAQSSMYNGVMAHEITAMEAQTLAKSGINWVSCDVTLNPSDDCQWQQVYSLAKQYHLSVLGILDWHLMNYSQTFTLNDWSNAVNQAVQSFGDVVKTWEIWNEPTYSSNWFGCFDGSASSYVALMQVTYNDIKALAPSDTVIGLGGMPLYDSENDTVNVNTQQAYAWATQVSQLGGGNYCDAIAVHAYPYGPYIPLLTDSSFTYYMQQYQQLFNKPIWVTEVGQESASTTWAATPDQQANFLNESYSLFQKAGAQAYIWYELNDNYTDRPNSNFGLFDSTGAPKQAFTTYADLASGASANPSPTPTDSSTSTKSQSTAGPTSTSSVKPATSTATPPVPELSVAIALPLIFIFTLCIALRRKKGQTNNQERSRFVQ